MEKSCDLLVIGGGPAGSTLAGLVKKHAPKRRVVLLEKAPGPRHHIGESLLPGIVPVLKELGAFEKVDRAGFPKKLGATYVWGPDRTPWDNDFDEINVSAMIERFGKLPDKVEYAWQVVRSRYDEILLRHASELGVEVIRGARAEGVLENGTRIAGVKFSAGRRRVSLRAGLTADCSGQDGFLSKYRKIRDPNPALKNVAVYAYYQGARWKYEYTGHPDKTRIFVCSTPSGWLWYIPVSREVVSIGLVTTADHLKKSRINDLPGLFQKEIRACREVWPLVKGAKRLKGFDGTSKEFFTLKDWSYLNHRASGPGWLAAGDAAIFVDPILSSGVTLAQLAAHRAAHTAISAWGEKSAAAKNRLWADYDLFCRESAAQYLALALFWYGNDPCAARWWKKALEIQRAWLPVPVSDKSAFVTVSAGLTRYYDRPISDAALADEQEVRAEEYPFHENVFPKTEPEQIQGGDERVPRLNCPWRVELAFVPKAKGPGLRPVQRVRFLKHNPDEPVQDALNPRKLVTRWHLTLLKSIDGRLSISEILAAASKKSVPAWWLARPARVFLRDLAAQGVLDFGAGG